jgi:CDP-alcohol phosphatidyltransferase
MAGEPSGRKIPPSLENPIDNFFIGAAETLNPALRRAGVTPNILTSLGLLAGMTSARLLARGHPRASAVLYLVSYFFDCADGNMARKYGMVTQFGDWYDHGADIAKHAALAWALLSLPDAVCPRKSKIRILVTAGIFFFAAMPCLQEQYPLHPLSRTGHLCGRRVAVGVRLTSPRPKTLDRQFRWRWGRREQPGSRYRLRRK